MAYDVTVFTKYNENCDYRQSETKEKIPIIDTLQPVTLTAVVNTPEIEIGETLELTVSCTTGNTQIPVKSGYILINDIPTKCFLNNNGQVTINYKPLTIDESIKITYHDTLGIFEEETITLTQENDYFKIKKISVNVEIIEQTEKITNFQEPVTIKIQVTDKNDMPVTYGRITFLHYLYLPKETETGLKEDRIEKIIGNPVYLNADGQAAITYIPMQDYEEDADLEDILKDKYNDYYVEYVRAVYNYDKESNIDEKDVTWAYYASNDALAYIYLKRDNYVIITGHYDNDEKTSLQPDPKNYIDYIEAKDKLLLKIKFYSNQDTNEDNELYFDIDELELDVLMQGTIVTPKNTHTYYGEHYDEYVNDYYNFNEYNDTIIAKYNTTDNAFYAQVGQLSPGYYDFYVKSFVPYGKEEIDTDLKKYLQEINESMHYYLKVMHNDSGNIDIVFTEDTYEMSTTEPIDIEVNVRNLTDSQLQALLGEKCILQSPFGKIQETQLIHNEEDGNILKAIFQDIGFSSAKNYSIYAYINGVIKDAEYIPPLYTNNIIVRVSGELQPNINVNILNQVYPGSIQYTASINNLNNEIIEGYVYNYKKNENKSIYATHIFDAFDFQHQGVINDLDADSYVIDFEFNGIKTTAEYNIDQASINLELSDKLKKGIVAFPQQIASIILSSTGKNLSTIDVNKLHVFIKPSNEETFTECTINNITLVDVNNEIKAMVDFVLGQYVANEWDIKIQYDEDKNFNYVYKTLSFNTSLLTPSYTISEDSENNITIDIDNPQLEFIPLLIELTDNSDIRRFIGVTDLDGKVTLTSPADKILWNNLNKINITTNPTNTQLIESILNIDRNNIDTQSILYDDFERVFYGEYSTFTEDEIMQVNEELMEGDEIPVDDTIETPVDDTEEENEDTEIVISQDEAILTGLYNQLINYESTYLFTAYKEDTKTYYR